MNEPDNQNHCHFGIPEIDGHHQELIKMINRLAKSANSGTVDKEMGRVLIRLVDYTKNHFIAEEKLMQSIEYPDLDIHRKMHREFNNEIAAILKRIRDDQELDVFDLMNFIRDWLLNHVNNEDAKIAEVYAARKKALALESK